MSGGSSADVISLSSQAACRRNAGHGQLHFYRDRRLLAQLAPEASPCLVRPLPPGLKVGHYQDEDLIFDEVDQYGEPLTCTTSTDLRRLRLPDDLAPWNQAIVAFLRTLPPQARIVLYWC